MKNMDSRRRKPVRLTPLEARALDMIVHNGWGDGSFGGWLHSAGGGKLVQAGIRAMEKASLWMSEGNER